MSAINSTPWNSHNPLNSIGHINLNSINPNLAHRILITLSPTEINFITLQTYTPDRGKSQRFYVDKSAIISLLSGDKHSFLDSDLHHYLHLRFDGSALSCKAVWLSVNACDNVKGHVQRFSIPASVLHKVLSGKQVNYVSHTNEPLPKSRLVFSSDAQAAIKKYASNKHTRRALSKFFRDNLNYGTDELINVYADTYANGFYICSPVTGFNGGIILHKGSARYYGFPTVSFSLHT